MIKPHSPFCLFLLFSFLLFRPAPAVSQEAAAVDSIKQGLAVARTAEEKAWWLDNLSRTLMNVNQAESERYGQQLIALAEESRDRKLMIFAYMSNGFRNSYMRGQKIFCEKAIVFFDKALSIARQERRESDIAAAQLQLAEMYLSVPDREKAFKYVSEAFSRISTLADDSLAVEGNITYGNVYLSSNDRTLALRHFYAARRLAEEIKADKPAIKNRKAMLMRNSYLRLSSFYSRIEEYDRAIDYYTLAYHELDKMNDKRIPYQRCIDVNALGNLFAAKKNHELAISYYERSIRMADSLKFSTLKVPGYISLLNQYLRMDQPLKAKAYLDSPDGQALQQYLSQLGMGGVIDQAYAYVFTELNLLDSARVRYARALPYFEQTMSGNNRLGFYLEMGHFHKKAGETGKAIEYYQKAKEGGDKNGVLEISKKAAQQLDSLYLQKGDYKQASIYGGIYYQYKDSIEKLNKEKELAQVEAADEQLRQERIQREKEEQERRKNNIQYMAITMGIVVLFVALVVLGMFKVPAGLIRAIGFFVFLMLFEFIFLVFKKNIHAITHGEPWKDLAFMIMLAALLVPLHHWMEHKVLHYLTSHNRLTAAGQHIKTKIFRRNGRTDL